MAQKLGGNAEFCSVCGERVYPLDKLVIEKLVMHKPCFKCKHCDRKLSLTNFAAVNNTVYCKVHYLKLFRESGGKYDKAFGDGGFQKKSSSTYTPGQFQGVGKSLPVHVTSPGVPQMSPVLTSKMKEVAVSRLEPEDTDEGTGDESELVSLPPSAVSSDEQPKPSVKDMLRKFESSLPDSSSVDSDSLASPRKSATHVTSGLASPDLHGNSDVRQKWLSGVSSQHIKLHTEVDRHPGGTVQERKAAYLASVSGVESANVFDESPTKSPLHAASHFKEDDQPSLHGNLQNRLEWSKNLGPQHIKAHTEIDRSPGGNTTDRVEAYLAAVSNASPSASPVSADKNTKKVSKLVSEKVKVFSSPPNTSSPERRFAIDTSPSGAVSERVREFTEKTFSKNSSPESTPVFNIGRIDDRVHAFEDAANACKINKDDGLKDMPKSPSEIRSFNEGANGTLRRTPSWLRQQRALQQQQEEESTTVQHQEEEKTATSDEVAQDTAVATEDVTDTVETPSTPTPDSETPPTTTPESIMKRTGSWKKEKASSSSRRSVRFGMAEIHELPSSPKTPEVTDVPTVRGAVGGHSASKGSALAMYLKYAGNGGGAVGRKRAYEPPEETHAVQHVPVEDAHAVQHVESPPPPILSPGARSPKSGPSFASSEDVLGSVDEPSLLATEPNGVEGEVSAQEQNETIEEEPIAGTD